MDDGDGPSSHCSCHISLPPITHLPASVGRRPFLAWREIGKREERGEREEEDEEDRLSITDMWVPCLFFFSDFKCHVKAT